MIFFFLYTLFFSPLQCIFLLHSQREKHRGGLHSDCSSAYVVGSERNDEYEEQPRQLVKWKEFTLVQHVVYMQTGSDTHVLAMLLFCFLCLIPNLF